MFKQLFVLLTIFSIITSRTASASTTESLKQAYEEMHFALTVKWDQKDKSFEKAEHEKFAAKVRDLKAKGLTQNQMLEFAKAEINDTKVAKDIETAMTMIQINKMSSKEASDYMTETLKKSFSSGASWEQYIVPIGGIITVLLCLAIFIVDKTAPRDCKMVDRWICETSCSYDFFGPTSCHDECYWGKEESCL